MWFYCRSVVHRRVLATVAGHLRDVVSDEARKLSLSAGSGAGA